MKVNFINEVMEIVSHDKFSIPLSEIKFGPPPQGKYFGVHILSPLLNWQIFLDVENSSKNGILLVLLSKL